MVTLSTAPESALAGPGHPCSPLLHQHQSGPGLCTAQVCIIITTPVSLSVFQDAGQGPRIHRGPDRGLQGGVPAV